MTVRYFAPGEILTKLQAVRAINSNPSALDIILYIEKMLADMHIMESVVRVRLNLGELFFGCIEEADTRFLYVEDAQDATLFFASKLPAEQWNIVTFKDGDWTTLIEQAYDKVRMHISTPSTFISSPPPIGVVYRMDSL